MVAHPEGEPSRVEQHNHGAGAFVGRDNYGTINAIDKTTQAILEKLSQEAPALARLLRKALRDGVVSPDVVHALEYAARNINEDVANALLFAGKNINEDVARRLLDAGTKISEAREFAVRVERALEGFERISGTLGSLTQSYGRDSLIDQLNETVDSIRIHADRVEGVVTPPPVQIVVNWKPTFYAFVFGFLAGIALFTYLMQR
ncbi:hypothetical protein [Microtetraspora sp. NBRC 16547]|uniref:hypothetical protein n=1 Tax=Microtetraspora sp. NBRC 16547 TaxID=3030993 RepID=UPI0024A554CE|nr:hypothetical protein [Microtetraspora sp. NBRC 16547]GLX02183.1 hypothetical protein Misp02_62690 [Microtetraspora sp. NBRC 16547]